jgi:hypothetical protein
MRYAFPAAMRRSAYPLKTLADVRERQVDEAVRGLATAVAARQAADDRRAAIETRKEAHGAHAASVRDAERRALERGELSAADLAVAHAWQLRMDAERGAMEAEEQRAREGQEAALQGERDAQGQLSARRADAQVLGEHRARWAEGERKRVEAAEEESAAEAFRLRR